MRELFRSLQWLEPVIELLRMGCFLTFIALLLFHLAGKSEAVRRRRAGLVIGFVVVITTIVGVIQVDAWPFTNWALVHALRSPVMHSWQIEGIDDRGRAWIVDNRVLQPVPPEEFGASLGILRRVRGAEREEFLRFLFERAERGRRAVAEGRGFPANEWILGPLTAPYHFASAKLWRSPSDVPPSPFRSIRVVFTVWDIHERARRGDAAVQRELIASYP